MSSFSNASGTTSWRVSGTGKDGKRIRENYDTESDALIRKGFLEKESRDLSNGKRLAETVLSDSQLSDAEAAVRLAGARALSAIVGEYSQLETTARKHGKTLMEAMHYFDQHYRNPIAVIAMEKAVEQFLSNRVGVTNTTTENYRHSLQILTNAFPTKPVHKVTVADLDDTLGKKSLASQRSHRGRISTFFEWAVKRSYTESNPCHKLDKLNSSMGQIATLSFEKVKRLLRGAMALPDGRMVATVAIGLFAGLRPSEIRDLKPEQILDAEIRVSGGKLRRQHKRVVAIPANLRVWLDAYPFRGVPSTFKRDYEALKSITAAEHWVKDIIRHTSISFQYARDKNKATVADKCGTSVKEIDQHYLQIILDDNDIQNYWQLTPDNVDEVTIASEKLPEPVKRIPWPSNNTMRLLLEKGMNYSLIGRGLGCSANAVKKHCRKIGLVG